MLIGLQEGSSKLKKKGKGKKEIENTDKALPPEFPSIALFLFLSFFFFLLNVT